jgi:predicted Co/Zn/Cd cation transporter (cation efflux family)
MENKKTCNRCFEHQESIAMEICRILKNRVKKWCFVACVEFVLLVGVVIGYILK